MRHNIDYSLYLVTDRTLMSVRSLEEAVEQAIKGGCTLVQLREKESSTLDFYNAAEKVKAVADRHGVPLIINDRLDIALAVDAAGVHVGQADLPAKIVRRIIEREKILGVSASSLSEAVRAQEDGADYIGVGAMFATNAKTDAKLVSIEELKKIRAAVNLPLVIIGGINKNNVNLFEGLGIDGIAAVSAIISQSDISLAAKELKDSFAKIRRAYNA